VSDVVQSLPSPLRLAIAYARKDLRAPFALLLTFDQRLANIVGRASEPMIAQMKLAWWHEAIMREPTSRPQGEPTFQILNELNMPHVEAAMVRLLDAWGRVLATDDWDAEILSAFAKDRSAGIFGAYADLAGYTDDVSDVSDVGQSWALADLKHRFGHSKSFDRAPQQRTKLTKRRLRPLSILAASVESTSGIGMVWHALTGR
jgi:phytoene synthase